MAYLPFLSEMAVQKFSSIEDLDRYGVTVEEREEYEPYLRMGVAVYAGVDYERILKFVEKECDVIHWDGGNNDWPFFKPDFTILVADAMRPSMEVSSFPGEVNLRMADVVIINKVREGREDAVDTIKRNVRRVNERAEIVLADSEIKVDNSELLKGRRAVVIEDSPTVTHGGLPYGAGYVAALENGAEIVDPRPFARGVIAEMYERYPHIGPVIPSTGYSQDQIKDLEEMVNSVDADVIVLGTPTDLSRIAKFNKPSVRVTYELRVIEGSDIPQLVDTFLEKARDKIET